MSQKQKPLMKTCFIILFFCVIGFNHAIAQYVSVPYTVPTPYGNMSMSQHIYMPTHYYNSNSNPKFNFEVTLKNDSVVKFKSRILSENKKMYVLFKEHKTKRKVVPNETKVVYGNSTTWGRIKGLPADSCWLFKMNKGAINCYSSVPMIDINSTIAIQEGEKGEIVALTKENLQGITGKDDDKIVKWLNKNKLIKVIEYFNKNNKATL
jgi:hypothetical protein